MKKERKYYFICAVFFGIAIYISSIARNAPQALPGDFSSSAAGFQVLMGGLFSLCIQVVLVVAITRMYML